MANGDAPGPAGSAGANDHPQLTNIEERVARLELELAALQLQVASKGIAHDAALQIAPAAWTPAPPPPPIAPRTESAPPPIGDQPLRSEAWAAARPVAPPIPESRDSFESRLGSQIFNRIAIVLLLIGTAYGMKWSADHGWIGPAGRVILGLLTGAALVLWSERFRKKGFAAFSYSLKAVGSGVLYLSLWAAFRLYGLLPASLAICLMILVTAWNAFMAWVQDSELLAVYAIAGGFVTPMLLSTGGNHETFLFTYVLAIDIATVVLVRLRKWPRLLIGSFPLTVAYFIGWYLQFYGPEELATTSVFIALFTAAFASVPLWQGAGGEVEEARQRRRSTLLEDILLPLTTAAFTALAGYAVLQEADYHSWLPWLMVGLATVYLALMRLPQTAVARAIHLSLAVVLLTIAVPLKASGAWITVSWLVEGLALIWVATRLGADEATGGYASKTLRLLASAALALGLCGVCFHLFDSMAVVSLPLWNKGTGTALTAIAVFAAAAWLAMRAGTNAETRHAEPWDRIVIAAILMIAITAALLTMREVAVSWNVDWAHPAFATPDFAMALAALAIFAGLVAVSFRVSKSHPGEEFWAACGAGGTIAFNLIAVLTGVREISAIWAPSPNQWTADSGLQQALAISAFLMLYGAALLAVGFWRRSGFLRWQALLLLVFTIFKAFFYDMRNLSQGYRVVSFLGLGALLLAISFAYQKDWLHLRKAALPAQDADSEAAK